MIILDLFQEVFYYEVYFQNALFLRFSQEETMPY